MEKRGRETLYVCLCFRRTEVYSGSREWWWKNTNEIHSDSHSEAESHKWPILLLYRVVTIISLMFILFTYLRFGVSAVRTIY